MILLQFKGLGSILWFREWFWHPPPLFPSPSTSGFLSLRTLPASDLPQPFPTRFKFITWPPLSSIVSLFSWGTLLVIPLLLQYHFFLTVRLRWLSFPNFSWFSRRYYGTSALVPQEQLIRFLTPHLFCSGGLCYPPFLPLSAFLDHFSLNFTPEPVPPLFCSLSNKPLRGIDSFRFGNDFQWSLSRFSLFSCDLSPVKVPFFLPGKEEDEFLGFLTNRVLAIGPIGNDCPFFNGLYSGIHVSQIHVPLVELDPPFFPPSWSLFYIPPPLFVFFSPK